MPVLKKPIKRGLSSNNLAAEEETAPFTLKKKLSLNTHQDSKAVDSAELLSPKAFPSLRASKRNASPAPLAQVEDDTPFAELLKPARARKTEAGVRPDPITFTNMNNGDRVVEKSPVRQQSPLVKKTSSPTMKKLSSPTMKKPSSPVKKPISSPKMSDKVDA